MEEKEQKLLELLRQHRALAVAFSGGADSAYLLFAAKKSGVKTAAYYVKTPFQPAFELRDAEKLASELDIPLRVIALDVLNVPEIAENGAERCYYCKRAILSAVRSAASDDGADCLCDGSNASDDTADRPGFRALRELRVRSPLREAGLTKAEIRALSKAAGLFTWDKPAYACLATRIPRDTPVTAAALSRTERAEDGLWALGFRDFRVRDFGGTAKLELRREHLPLALEKRQELLTILKEYDGVVLNLEVRQ